MQKNDNFLYQVVLDNFVWKLFSRWAEKDAVKKKCIFFRKIYGWERKMVNLNLIYPSSWLQHFFLFKKIKTNPYYYIINTNPPTQPVSLW